MSQPVNHEQLNGPHGPHFDTQQDSTDLAAWTEVEQGRFMPRRVRGSCLGRALG